MTTTAPLPVDQASTAPDEHKTARAYRDHARRYDHRTRTFHHWREQLVRKLDIQSGGTVLDVGCGTGLCLPGLQNKIGPTGTIVGIDASEHMLDLAAHRVRENHWGNVHLVSAPVAEAEITVTADAALFCAVHDVMQSREAVANVFAHLRPGAAVAAIGGKWPAPWLWPLRYWVADLHAPFITDFNGFDQPWRLLAEHVPGLTVQQLGAGTGYLAHGYYPGASLVKSKSQNRSAKTRVPLNDLQSDH